MSLISKHPDYTAPCSKHDLNLGGAGKVVLESCYLGKPVGQNIVNAHAFLQLDIFWLENIFFERFPKVMPITDTYRSTCDLAHTPQGLPN